MGGSGTTKITIVQEGDRRTLTAIGHATGSPEVCAAISSLLYALAGYLANIIQEELIEFHENRLESGDVSLDFTGGGHAASAFDMTAIGLLQIAQQYPAYLEVETIQK